MAGTRGIEPRSPESESDILPMYEAPIWWARLVSIQLPPKRTDLQSAAVADLLLTHIAILFNFGKKYSETCQTIKPSSTWEPHAVRP